jgi:hypothetical protein
MAHGLTRFFTGFASCNSVSPQFCQADGVALIAWKLFDSSILAPLLITVQNFLAWIIHEGKKN